MTPSIANFGLQVRACQCSPPLLTAIDLLLNPSLVRPNPIPAEPRPTLVDLNVARPSPIQSNVGLCRSTLARYADPWATNQGRFRPPVPGFVRCVLSCAGQCLSELGRLRQFGLNLVHIREIAAECPSFGRLRRKLSGSTLHLLRPC